MMRNSLITNCRSSRRSLESAHHRFIQSQFFHRLERRTVFAKRR